MANTDLVYGLQDMEAYRDVPLSQIGYVYVNEAIDQFRTAYNGMVDSWLSAVANRNPAWDASPINVYRLPYAVDMQPVDEFGKATPVTQALSYEFGLPLARVEAALGESWERSLLRTPNTLNEGLQNLMHADKRWMKKMAMQALFTNTGWTFKSHEEDANVPLSIPVKPLANNDSRLYPLKTGTLTTAQHYNAQADQPADATDPFPDIYDRLTRYASSTSNIVAFVNGTSLIAGIRGLTEFIPVSNSKFIQYGANTTTLSEGIQANLYFGDKVLGEHSCGITIVQWEQLPDSYIVTMDMGQKPLGIRMKPEAPLQGLFSTKSVSHYGNELVDRFRHIMGMAVVNPIACDITRTGNASYAIPTGYQVKI